MTNVRVTSKQKIQVKTRAKNCCEYCMSQEEYSTDTFSIEHIIPRAKGGSNHLDNLANACQGCNNRKFVSTDAVDPLTGEIVQLYHPRQDVWNEHFAWSYDFTLLVGLTPIGRATIDRLDLNRRQVMNLRHILQRSGLHPIS